MFLCNLKIVDIGTKDSMAVDEKICIRFYELCFKNSISYNWFSNTGVSLIIVNFGN